jgi:hypothetical protein
MKQLPTYVINIIALLIIPFPGGSNKPQMLIPVPADTLTQLSGQ